VIERRVRRLACALLALGLAGGLLPAHGAGLHFSCGYENNGPADEAKRIASRAQSAVRREGKRVLSVRTAQGVLRFQDKPPYDEPMAGTVHRFCDRGSGYTLVTVEEEGGITGVLVDEASGKKTRAGAEVLLSNDRRAYFAASGEDGLDGMIWKIHAIDGTTSWSGYNFIEQANGYSDTTLDTPAWTDTGEFTAMAQCLADDKRRWKVKLTKVNGKWQWLPKRTCPRS